MLWQCRCCGFMTPDHLKISSHMKGMHDIKFTPDPVAEISEEQKESLGEFSRQLFQNAFTNSSDMVKYSAPTKE